MKKKKTVKIKITSHGNYLGMRGLNFPTPPVDAILVTPTLVSVSIKDLVGLGYKRHDSDVAPKKRRIHFYVDSECVLV